MLPDDAPYVAHKLEELGVTAEELAQMIRVPVEDVEAWAAGVKEPPGPVELLISFMGVTNDAALTVQRNKYGIVWGQGRLKAPRS
jgi:hypothetical protein